MIGPIVFVGVGGSGAASVRFVYDSIRQRLIDRGWPWAEREAAGQAMPTCWQFVAIDVDMTGQPTQVPATPVGSIRDVRLAAPPDQILTMFDRTRTIGLRAAQLSWLPTIDQMPVINPYEGAGQYRAIGRLAAISSTSTMTAELKKAVAASTDHNAQSDLALLKLHCGLDTSVLPEHRRVVMLSSLAGGSGSGIWLDVAQWFAGRPSRTGTGWLSQKMYAFLYLPEVYENLDGPSAGIAPNSLLAGAELLSAYADKAPYNSSSQPVASLLNMAPQQALQKAPRNTFFIGSSSSAGLQYTDIYDVYGATAQTIAALVVGDGTGASFDRINVNQQATNDIPLLSRSNVLTSNIGYGCLDLGRRPFSQYASRRVLRETMIALLDGHRRAGRTLSEYETDEQVIARTTAAHELEFFERCGLHERDLTKGDNDQVLNAIYTQTRWTDEVALYLTNITDSVDRATQLGKKGERSRMVRNEFFKLQSSVTTDVVETMLRNLDEEAGKVRERVLSTVADFAAEHSMAVVVSLLQSLVRQLDEAGNQLQADLTTIETKETTDLDAFLADLKTPAKALDALTGHWDIKRRTLAIAFIRDVKQGLIVPLFKALQGWEMRARGDLKSSGLHRVVYDWNGRDVPTDLIPHRNVAIIDGPATFDATFQRLIGAVHGDSDGPMEFDPALRRSVAEVVRQVWDNRVVPDEHARTLQRTKQLFVRETEGFSLAPLHNRLEAIDEERQRLASATAATAQSARSSATEAKDPDLMVREAYEWYLGKTARCQLSLFQQTRVLDLESIATAWITSRPGAMTNFVQEGFAKWLDQSHDDIGERERRFVSAFTTAVSVAAPIAQISDSVVQRVHGNTPTESVLVSPYIPISSSQPLALALRKVVADQQLKWDGADFRTGADDTSRLEFIRTFSDGLHPLCYSSLTQSILDSYSHTTSQEFWRLRRARPLSETLGLTQAQIVALMRGWIVALMLNRIDEKGERVWMNGGWRQVPAASLAGVKNEGAKTKSALLHQALTRLPMQLIDFTQNPHALEFYVELARLGGYDTAGDGSTAQESTMNDPLLGGLDASKVRTMAVSCPALTAWVDAGVVEPGGPAPVDARAGSSSDKAGRVKAITDYLTDELGEFIKNGEILRRSAQIGVELTAEHEMLHYLAAARDQLLVTSPATPTVVAQKSSNGLS